MRLRDFLQIDVFTDRRYVGNPLAVVLDGEGLDTETMQRFTDWTNLSECTFLVPPTDAGRAAGADYRVRIFCPGRELPFAGHPTLGSCHAWLQAGGQPRGQEVVQECGVGLVRIRRDGSRLAFAAPPRVRSGPLAEADVALIARGLGLARDDILAHSWCDNGPQWRGVLLRSAEQVMALQADATVLAGLFVGVVGASSKVGVIARADHTAGKAAAAATAPGASADGGHAPTPFDFEVRAFFHTGRDLREDPVTGSLNAALAQWLIGAGLAQPRYVARQGTALGRDGRVYIEQSGSDIWVGGDSVVCIQGQVSL
jgi:PhzF family phenazine biosynthesis protein